MSFSEYFTAVGLDEIRKLEPKSEPGKSHRDQFDQARDAAVSIVEAGVVGDPERHRFSLTLSGHSNPDHEPASGWANDCVSVSVGQATPDAQAA